MCSFCGADFTLHERDLHTICPECMARVSDTASYCHHCACPLVPAGTAGEPTEYRCPACGDETFLSSRRIDPARVSVLECPRCAGLWVSGGEFDLLKERSRAVASVVEGLGNPASSSDDSRAKRQSGPLYRPCPICEKLMNRQNYGRRSGVIVDSCRGHGLWFDATELDGVLRWIRSGGEAAAQRRLREEIAEERRQMELRRFSEPMGDGLSQPTTKGAALGNLVAWLTGTLGF